MTERKKRITKIKAKKGEYFFAMVAHVIEICEFDERDAKRIIVSGITESHTDDNRYITITAQKSLEYSKAPLIISTPARPEWPQNEADSEDYCISRELGDDLKALESEAWRYIDGERAQQTLDFNGGDGGGDDGGDDADEPERIGA